MKIFDSALNKKWSGVGYEVRGNSIIALKSAKFEQKISIHEGIYVIKVLGKKRTGNGSLFLEIVGSKNEILLKEEVNFTSNSLSEHSFSFVSSQNLASASIKIYRNTKVYGSVELGRVYIKRELDKHIAKKSKTYSRNSVKDNLLQNELISNISSDIRKKSIAFIVPYGIYGGAEVYIENIINKLGIFNISIICMQKNKIQSKIFNTGVFVKTIGTLAKLDALLRASKYDYVAFYNRKDIYNLICSLKKRKQISSKIIEIYHSDFVWNGAISTLKSREYIDIFVSVSKSLGNDISGIKDNSRIVIPVGIDLSKFNKKDSTEKRKELGLSKDKIVIGTVARLSKEKQLDYLVKLAKVMPEQEFIIIGDGPERDNLLNMISTLNLKNIRLIGYKEDVHLYYNVFDAFVLASKIEGTPISILEAMASEVPVFSNMVGAIPDIITDKETGFKLEFSPELDKDIILSNFSNKEVILNARKYVDLNHDIKKASLKFIDKIKFLNNLLVRREDVARKFIVGELI